MHLSSLLRLSMENRSKLQMTVFTGVLFDCAWTLSVACEVAS
jgi:hypothetical protein